MIDGETKRRIAVCDAAGPFPINDVAFHPVQPIVAVAAGSYDGGYSFEGDLLLWNWRTGEIRRPIAESRDVVACRFVDDSRLAVLLRPRHEEEYEGNAFETFVGTVLEDLRDTAEVGLPRGDVDPHLRDLRPLDPGSLGFDTPKSAARDERELGRSLIEQFDVRHRTWDVRWTGPETLALVHDGCHLELWTARGERTHRFEGRGHGVQLLDVAGHLLVHVLDRGKPLEGEPAKSALFELESASLRCRREFDRAYLFSVDALGRILARDVREPTIRERSFAPRDAGRDLVLDPDTGTLLDTTLGHYDCFNHHVRLDGGDALLFLRGTPPTSHEHKRLCRVTRTLAVEEVLGWDGTSSHHMEGTACWIGCGDITLGYRVHDPNPSKATAMVERRSLATGATGWRVPLHLPPVALRHVPPLDVVVWATLDGQLGAVDARTGRPAGNAKLHVDGADTAPTCLDYAAGRLAVGTIDGRALVLRAEAI
ncbi:MAG TPA: hypothetical protein VLH36_01880 [Steroidobacteraceae bacterium]|nr:hypothetical protein [Steroidobacteraceae bacterium]